jgi:hypothetical protein
MQELKRLLQVPPPRQGDRQGSPLLGTMEPVTWLRVGQACGRPGGAGGED